jgi:hypothetical protein
MSTASTATVRKATEAINALEAQGIGVEAVKFDADADFVLILEDGGRVGTNGLGGGTVKEDVDTTGLGGGTEKGDTE